MGFQRTRLRWPEIVAGVAAAVLLLSMFLLPWYGYKGDLAPIAARLGVSTSQNAWHSLSATRWLLLLTIVAALALVYLQGTRRSPALPATFSLFVWLLGGAFSFAGAMAYAELAALCPRSGGEYVYLREAYGPLPAFLTGWTSFIAGFSGAIAASAVALAEYIGRFVPAAGNADPILTIPLPFLSLILSSKNLVALGAIALLTFAHLRGLGPGRLVQNTLASGKVIALAVFLVLGFALGAGHLENLRAPAPVAACSGRGRCRRARRGSAAACRAASPPPSPPTCGRSPWGSPAAYSCSARCRSCHNCASRLPGRLRYRRQIACYASAKRRS